MSALAGKLATAKIQKKVKTPTTPCFPVYGWGDQEDYEAVERLRTSGAEWKQVQQIVDAYVENDSTLELNKFIRHWRKACSCWQETQ